MHHTSKRLAWFMLATLMITPFAVGPALAQDDGSEDDDRRGAHGQDMKDQARTAKDRQMDMRANMAARASHFDDDDGTLTGRFVTFDADPANGTLTAVALITGAPLIESIDLGLENATAKARGATYRLAGPDSGVQVHDTKGALVQFKAKNGTSIVVTFPVGTNATAGEHGDDDQARFTIGFADNVTGWLAGENITTADNITFTIRDHAILKMDVGRALGRGHGDGRPDGAGDQRRADADRQDGEHIKAAKGKDHAIHSGQDTRAKVNQAIADGRIAIEVSLDDGTGAPVALELGHVKVKQALGDAQGRTKAHLTIDAPDGSPGTVVVLNLGSDALGDLTLEEAAAKLAVRFDNMTISPADDLADVMRWDDDEGPEYLLLIGASGVQAIVSVPHFSPHTIEVYETQDSEVEPANGAPVPGFLAPLALLAAAALVGRRMRGGA